MRSKVAGKIQIESSSNPLCNLQVSHEYNYKVMNLVTNVPDILGLSAFWGCGSPYKPRKGCMQGSMAAPPLCVVSSYFN